MVTINQRKVSPVYQGKRAFNELSEAGTLLGKQRITPTQRSLTRATTPDPAPKQRLGQLIDILA